jgi:hypothetical protein
LRDAQRLRRAVKVPVRIECERVLEVTDLDARHSRDHTREAR